MSWLKNILLGVLGLLVLVLLVVRFHKVPAPIDPALEAAAIIAHGPYEVEWQDEVLVDTSRPTAANGDFPGAESRKLKTRLWYPADKVNAGGKREPVPLLIYSHGFMSSRTGGEYLARYFASHGWWVASMDYPLTHFGASGGPNAKDVLNQPGDVSFLLDTLQSWSADPGHRFHGLYDEQRIALAGLSLGGLTTTLVAYHPEAGDPRVDAAVSIAGPSEMFGPVFFEHRSLPFMMVATEQDAMVNYRRNAARIPADVPGSVLVTIKGGSHAGFGAQSAMLRWLDNPDSLGCDALMSNVNRSRDEEPWFHLLGSAEQGIRESAMDDMCQLDPLPPAMNPLRQHQLNTLAVGSFLRSQFTRDPELRQRLRRYLLADFAVEFSEISVQSANP